MNRLGWRGIGSENRIGGIGEMVNGGWNEERIGNVKKKLMKKGGLGRIGGMNG